MNALSETIKVSDFFGKPTQIEIACINALLKHIEDPKKPTPPASLETILGVQMSGSIVVARDTRIDGKIIGMGTLADVKKINGQTGRVEHVGVLPEYGGKGIGKAICMEIIRLATLRGLRYLDLTTDPSRVAANALYPKLGFKLRTTNLYRLALSKTVDQATDDRIMKL